MRQLLITLAAALASAGACFGSPPSASSIFGEADRAVKMPVVVAAPPKTGDELDAARKREAAALVRAEFAETSAAQWSQRARQSEAAHKQTTARAAADAARATGLIQTTQATLAQAKAARVKAKANEEAALDRLEAIEVAAENHARAGGMYAVRSFRTGQTFYHANLAYLQQYVAVIDGR